MILDHNKHQQVVPVQRSVFCRNIETKTSLAHTMHQVYGPVPLVSQWVYSNQLYIYNENKKLASARQTEGHTDNIIVTKTCHHFPELQPSYLGQV